MMLALLLACTQEPILPAAPGPAGPSQILMEEVDPEALVDVDACSSCHPEQERQWRQSIHRMASFSNPYYRVSVDSLRKAVGVTATKHCGGCHDPIVMSDDGMDDVQPDDPQAHAGVTCLVCHGATHPTQEGNASFTLTSRAISPPLPGDEPSLLQHRAALSVPPELCSTCHRGLLNPSVGVPGHLIGQDDSSAHADSAWGGGGSSVDDVSPRSCIDCHMPGGSHLFPGGRTALSTSPEHTQATLDMLRTAAELYVLPGADHTVDVVIRNVGAGHRLPAGPTDTSDLRLEVTLTDATGHRLAFSDAHVLRAEPVDDQGQPIGDHTVQAVRAVAWNQSVPPRSAVVVRYQLPPGAPPDARVQAALVHHGMVAGLTRAACASDIADPRWPEGSQALDGRVIRPCEPVPPMEIARAEGSMDHAISDLTARLWHGEALLTAPQERVGEAEGPLTAAMQHPDPLLALRAMIDVAELRTRQGRADEALTMLMVIERRIGPRRALAAACANALAAGWMWPEVVDVLRPWASAEPPPVPLLRQMAMAAAAFDPASALPWTSAGLAARPFDVDLLRAQWLALDDLGSQDAPAAREAWLSTRAWDGADQARQRCFETHPDCALEAQGAHTHLLVPSATP